MANICTLPCTCILYCPSRGGTCFTSSWIWAGLIICFDIKCGGSDTVSVLSLSLKRLGHFHFCSLGTQLSCCEEVQDILLERKRAHGEEALELSFHQNITTWVTLTDNMWSNECFKLLSFGVVNYIAIHKWFHYIDRYRLTVLKWAWFWPPLKDI